MNQSAKQPSSRPKRENPGLRPAERRKTPLQRRQCLRSRASHQAPVIHGEAGFAYLEKEIKTDAALAPADIKDLFCKLWPDAKAAVDALEKIIKILCLS